MEEYTTCTYKYGSAEIVVHRPIIKEQERKKREEAIKQALVCYGKSKLAQREEGA